jgi:HPt (histidine-containing phosphotransfer) domain-containing protein
VTGRLDEDRLRDQAASPRPGLYAGIARGWVAALPATADRIRAADAGALPRALHELRSGAVAVGLPALAGALAALEQRAERGDAPAPGELDDALDLAARSAEDLARWWSAAPAAHRG